MIKTQSTLRSIFATLCMLVVSTSALAAIDFSGVTALADRMGKEALTSKLSFEEIADKSVEKAQIVPVDAGHFKIRATSVHAASLAMGVYLRDVAKGHISWCGKRMPTEWAVPTTTIDVQARYPMAMAYNYCTLSYTMAYWSKEAWQDEIDRLALSGYSQALCMAGVQKIWQLTMQTMGYTKAQQQDFICDDAVQAWWLMGNLQAIGNQTANGHYPIVSDAEIDEDAATGKFIVEQMRAVGIEPILQGFIGLVPSTTTEKQIADKFGYDVSDISQIRIFRNGNYVVSQKNPDLIDPTCAAFKEFSDEWNKNLKIVYGMDTAEKNPKFLGGDLFHESSPPGSMTYEQKVNCAVNVQKYQQAAFPGVTWVLQSWQGSPDQTLRNGLDPEHTVIQFLDQTMSATDARNSSYYNQTTGKYLPWVWVEVMNFGGNTGMHGAFRRFRNVGNLGSGNEYFKGYGLLSEGLETNPISYDMYNSRFTETTQDAQNISDAELEPWMASYRQRRYGLTTDDEDLKAANTICARTVWDCNRNQQGTIESAFCAFPSYSVSKVSAWGPTTGTPYEPSELIIAAQYFLDAANKHPEYLNLETFRYDFVEIFQQILADRARQILPDCATSKKRRDEFRRMLDLLDQILACSDEWRLDKKEARVIGKAPTTGPAAYRRMITTWTPGKLGQTQLSQYAHRSYAGLVKNYYARKWNAFFDIADGTGTKAAFDALCVDLDQNFPTATLPAMAEANTFNALEIAQEIMDLVVPPALTWNGAADSSFEGANWSTVKKETVEWAEEKNAVLSGYNKTITAGKAVTVGNMSFEATEVALSADGWIDTSTPLTIAADTSIDTVHEWGFKGTMSGGWFGNPQRECEATAFHKSDISTQNGVRQFTIQFQAIDFSDNVYWLKAVSAKIYQDGSDVKILSTGAANNNGGALGSGPLSPASNIPATSSGYCVKKIRVLRPSTLTLAGPITIGAVNVENADITFNFASAISGDIDINGGKLTYTGTADATVGVVNVGEKGATIALPSSGTIKINNVVFAGSKKLVLTGSAEALLGNTGSLKVKAPRDAAKQIVYLGSTGVEQSLKLDSDGYLQVRFAASTHSTFLTDQYVSTGWKNVSLKDLSECEFTGTMGGKWVVTKTAGAARGYLMELNDNELSMWIQAYDSDGHTKGVRVVFTLDEDGFIYVKSTQAKYTGSRNTLGTELTTNGTLATADTANGYGVASITATPALARVEATKSNYSDFAAAVNAATALTDKSMTLLDDTNYTGARIQKPFILTIPEGLTLKADNGQNDPFHWNYANVFNVYGTLDFGSRYQSAAGTKGFGINLYGGELTASGDNALSVYEATTFNVHADGEKTTSKITSGMQIRAAITLNVDAGATLVMEGNFNDSGDSKSGTPGVHKTGEGLMIFSGRNNSTNYPMVLEAGTLRKQLGKGDTFVLTINGGTAEILALDDENCKITETINGAVHTFTCVEKDNKFRVTNPGEISDNMPGKNFETIEEALEYAMKLYAEVEGMQVVKIWMLTDKLDAAKEIMAAYNAANGTNFIHFGDGNGNELQGWQPAADEKNPFDAVKAIIGRLAGGYNGASEEGLDTEAANEAMAKFVFQLMDGEGDVATVGPNPDQEGTILIKATNVSAASFALGQYIRHTAKMHISWCGNRVTTEFPIPTETTTYTPAVPVRFAYNYCTLSYTMAFWSAKEWREEIDRLALSGYNVALVLQGLQEAWRVTLESVHKANGDRVYSNEQIMKYVSDEAAQAWWHMGNLEGLGGPLGGEKGKYDAPGAYDAFKARTAADAELGEYIYAEMMKLGIQPSIQSFVGLVPDCSNGILDYGVASDGKTFREHANFSIINEGGWQGYTRPDVVNPLNIAFDEMSKAWYGALVDIYKPAQNGYTKYMGGDLFHEGGNKGSLTDTDLANIAVKIQNTQNDYFGKNGNVVTWVIQSWQGSPYQGIRNGLDTSKAIIQLLDKDMSTTGSVGAGYYAYKSTGTEHIPWIWVEVMNFGGNTGMFGGARRFRNLAKIGTDGSKTDPNSHAGSFRGYGILSEGLETNPMMYDMFNDAFTRTVGQDTSIDETKIDAWVSEYCLRRYGLTDKNLESAFAVLISTVYDCSKYQEGCIENILCAGPDSAVANVSKWGPTTGIEYDPAELYPAAYAFLDAAKQHPELLDLETFRYDFVELFLQLLGEKARVINGDIVNAGSKRNLFIKLLDLAERITASSNRWRLDWHEARTNTVCPGNEGIRGYRRMITCWADGYAAGQATGLREYAHRAYAGLIKDYYAKRWLAWFDKLDGKITAAQYTAFLSALDDSIMTAVLEPTASGDLVKLGEEILETVNPPALTLDATEGAVDWTTSTWTDAKGQSTVWIDDFDVKLSGVSTISATSPVQVGSLTLNPSTMSDIAVYTGYLPQGAANAVKLFNNLSAEDRENVAYFRGTMNGGWVKVQGEAKSFQMNDGDEYLEMQMQRVDDGYLKSVRVRTYFNPTDNAIWGYAVDAGNLKGGVVGANVTGTGTKVATSDGGEGYGIKEFAAVLNSTITLNGSIAINGTLTIAGGKLTLTTAAQANAPSEILIQNGSLILDTTVGTAALRNVTIGAAGKLIIMGELSTLSNITFRGTRPKGTIILKTSSEEIPLEVLKDGSLKIALAAQTYEGEITSTWHDIGWKNLTLDDLAICEFISEGVRASNVNRAGENITMTIGDTELSLGFNNGIVCAKTSSGSITGLKLNPAEAQIVSNKTNYATIDEAITVANGTEIRLLTDAELRNSTKAALTLTIPSGLTFKAEGNKLPWDQGNATYNVYGTIDFGSSYKEFGYNNARHHVLNLYAGSEVKSQNIVSFYTAFTLNVLANLGKDTVVFEPTFRSCWDTTINVASGVKLVLKNNIVPRANSGQTGSAAPTVIKTGDGELVLGGILAEGPDAIPSITVNAGKLSRALEPEEIFSAKIIDTGTAYITSADEDYEVVEPAAPVENVHTWKSQGIVWLFFVTDPGVTAQNGANRKFRTFKEAYKYGLQLRKDNPGQTVKLWGVVANDGLVKETIAEVGPQLGLDLDWAISPAGMEILGWDEPIRYYYTSGSTSGKTWNVSDKVTGYQGDMVKEENHTITAGDIIMFDKSKGSGYTDGVLGYLYIDPAIVCTEIDVVNATTIQLVTKYGIDKNVPNGWTVNVGKDSVVRLCSLHTGYGVKVPEAQFNGEGTVTIGTTTNDDKTLGKISGTAVITIPDGVTIKQYDDKSYIENALAGSGTLQVKNVNFAYTLADGSQVKFTIDPSVVGSWKVVTNGSVVTFEEDIRRLWTGDAVATQAGEYTDLLIGITLDELINGKVYELGANFNGRRSYPPVVYSGITETSAIATFDNGSETATLELVQDGVKIKGRQTSGATITRVAAAIHYSFKGSASWNARPEELIDEDIIVVERFAELTLNYSFANHFVGEGTVITTVAPSTDLKDSSQFHNWKGTLVLSGLTVTDAKSSDYGNANSIVELKNCSGSFARSGSSSVPLKISGTLTITDGFSGGISTIAKLMGDGVIELNKSLASNQTIKVLDSSEWNGVIEETEDNSVKILFATIKIGDNFYFTNQEAKDASEPGQTIEFLKTSDGQNLSAKDPTQTLRVHSGFNGNYTLDSTVEGLYYKSADLVGDGRSDLKFFAATDTAFGKTWTNVFLGPTMQASAGNWMTSTEWSRKNGNLLVRLSNGMVPHVSGTDAYTSCLIDGTNLRRVPVGNDGYKHVEAGTIDGWNTAIGVTNGVAVTISGYAKMQGGNNDTNYIYVDKTSKLTLNGSPTKFEKYFNLHSAGVEGITIGFNRTDAKYNHYLEGDGTVHFSAQNINGTHVIKSAAISLGAKGSGDTMKKGIKSKKLVSFQSHGTITASIADDAIITKTSENTTDELSKVDRAVTTDDNVGTYTISVKDDGIYLDYVAWTNRRYLRWNNAKTYWETTDGNDGNGNRGKAYLTTGTDMTAGEVVEPKEEVVITTDDVVQFDSGFGDKTLYINPNLRGMCIKVLTGTTLRIGRANGQTTIPAGFYVVVEDGAKVILTSWRKEEAVIGDGVTFVCDTSHVGEGSQGEIEVDSDRVSSLSIGSLTSSVPVQTDSIPVKITNPSSSATIVVADTKDAAAVEVKISAQWVNSTFMEKAVDLKSEGENGMKVWESYILGLSPTDEASTPIVAAEQTNDPDTFKLDIPNVTIVDSKESGVTVTPKLLVGDTVDGFTEDDKASYDNGFTISVPTGDTKVKYYKIKYEIK